MKRLSLAAALLAAGFVLGAPSLWAHGGQFRGPGGNVPPTLREPTRPDAAAPAARRRAALRRRLLP